MPFEPENSETHPPRLLRVPDPDEFDVERDSTLDNNHFENNSGPERQRKLDDPVEDTDEAWLDDESWLDDDSWLDDQGLIELASQLNADASFLVEKYPSAEPSERTTLAATDRIHRHGANAIKSETLTESGTATRKRSRMGRQWASGVTLASLALLAVSISYSFATFTESDRTALRRSDLPSREDRNSGSNHRLNAMSRSTESETDSRMDGTPPTAIPPEALAATHQAPGGPRSNDGPTTALDLESPNLSESNIVTTPVSHHPNSMIYFATQAELEGLIDAADRSPTNKIRIGF